jgi:hypothetical protein
MSYLDDITYDESCGPKGRVAPTYDDLLAIFDGDEDSAAYWADSGHDLTTCDSLYDDEDSLIVQGWLDEEAEASAWVDAITCDGDTFTQQLAAELDADMAAIAFRLAFGEVAA